MKKFTKVTAAALAATLSLSLAACGSSASTDAASTASADGAVYRTLDEIKADGTINIGVFSDKNPFRGSRRQGQLRLHRGRQPH